jgi:hypothetical protein
MLVSTPEVFGEPSIPCPEEHDAGGIGAALTKEDRDIASSNSFPLSFVGAGTPRGHAPGSDSISLGR